MLITGSCTSEIGYFRIQLNRFDMIETVTCFNKKDFEVRHMVALYGKHESLLNELKTRFEVNRFSLFCDVEARMKDLKNNYICHRDIEVVDLGPLRVLPGTMGYGDLLR